MTPHEEDRDADATSNVELSEIAEKTLESQIDSPEKRLGNKLDEHLDLIEKPVEMKRMSQHSDKRVEIPQA